MPCGGLNKSGLPMSSGLLQGWEILGHSGSSTISWLLNIMGSRDSIYLVGEANNAHG